MINLKLKCGYIQVVTFKMAQQKGKKNSSPWSQCESCGTNLINKDIELHSKDCPPEQNQQNYDFIKDNILYGTVDVKTNEEIKNLASSEKDFLVFLSQSAIQLTNLSIGDWCKVEGGPVSIAKIVWPTTEKTLTSILFTRNSKFKVSHYVKRYFVFK